MAMAKPPLLTSEDRGRALQLARESRKRRADFKSKVRSGQLRWYQALDSNDEAIMKMRVKELLESIPKLGEIRVTNLLDSIGISHARRIQGLGSRQKNELLRELANR
jgi:guanylate kinase